MAAAFKQSFLMAKVLNFFSAPLAVIILLAFFASSLRAENSSGNSSQPRLQHVLSLSDGGAPAYDFEHLPHVNPQAPKGGRLRLHATGSFDTMNPFSSLGELPYGRGLTSDSLMFPRFNDVYTVYPLVAEGYILNTESEPWIEFHIDPRARFHDGSPVTAEDVKFSFEGSMENLGHGIQQFFRDITGVEVKDSRRVRFLLRKGFSESVLVYIAILQVQSKAFWADKDISREYVGKVLGCGPYEIESYKQGESIVYKKVTDYWGKDLPVARGRYNFSTISYDYFRDGTVAFEAFLAGLYDFREELVFQRWEYQYKGKYVDDGSIVRETFRDVATTGMRGLVFNLRRPLFQSREVRKAILLAFDFEWGNKAFFNGSLRRIRSFYGDSPYEVPPLPDEEEKALLKPYLKYLPENILTEPPALPISDGKGFNRDNLIKAQRILENEGFTFKDGVLLDPENKRPVYFEIITNNTTNKKLIIPFLQNLERIGIQARIRVVDGPNLVYRKQNNDYDLLESGYGFQSRLGREQWLFWHSANRDIENSQNRVGANHPAVDFLTEQIAQTKDRRTRINAGRALDRVLLSECYAIPMGVNAMKRVAYQKKIRPPYPMSEYDVMDIHSWWAEAR